MKMVKKLRNPIDLEIIQRIYDMYVEKAYLETQFQTDIDLYKISDELEMDCRQLYERLKICDYKFSIKGYRHKFMPSYHKDEKLPSKQQKGHKGKHNLRFPLVEYALAKLKAEYRTTNLLDRANENQIKTNNKQNKISITIKKCTIAMVCFTALMFVCMISNVVISVMDYKKDNIHLPVVI